MISESLRKPTNSAAPSKMFKRKFLFGHEYWLNKIPFNSKPYSEMLTEKTKEEPTGKDAIILLMCSLLSDVLLLLSSVIRYRYIVSVERERERERERDFAILFRSSFTYRFIPKNAS